MSNKICQEAHTCNEAHRLTTDQQCLLMSTYMSRSTPAYHNTCFYQDFTPSDTPHQLSGSPQQVIRLLLLLILAVAKSGRFPLLSGPPRLRRTGASLTQNGEMADCPTSAWTSKKGTRPQSSHSHHESLVDTGVRRLRTASGFRWILLLQLLSLRPHQPMLCHSSLVLSPEDFHHPHMLAESVWSFLSVCDGRVLSWRQRRLAFLSWSLFTLTRLFLTRCPSMRSSIKDVLVRSLREGVGSSIGSTWYETWWMEDTRCQGRYCEGRPGGGPGRGGPGGRYMVSASL